eukprot:SM000319S12271  [mRNA]  locus=s319:30912:31598:+ [translate_table: standard]
MRRHIRLSPRSGKGRAPQAWDEARFTRLTGAQKVERSAGLREFASMMGGAHLAADAGLEAWRRHACGNGDPRGRLAQFAGRRH